MERETNQGSLGSIDALLGCPLYLPKHQVWELYHIQLVCRTKSLFCIVVLCCLPCNYPFFLGTITWQFPCAADAGGTMEEFDKKAERALLLWAVLQYQLDQRTGTHHG